MTPLHPQASARISKHEIGPIRVRLSIALELMGQFSRPNDGVRHQLIREDVPALLAEVDRLQGLLGQIQIWIDDEQLPSSVLGGRVYNLIRPSRAESSR